MLIYCTSLNVQLARTLFNKQGTNSKAKVPTCKGSMAGTRLCEKCVRVINMSLQGSYLCEERLQDSSSRILVPDQS